MTFEELRAEIENQREPFLSLQRAAKDLGHCLANLDSWAGRIADGVKATDSGSTTISVDGLRRALAVFDERLIALQAALRGAQKTDLLAGGK